MNYDEYTFPTRTFIIGVCVWSMHFNVQSKQFITVKNGQFIKNDRPYYYIGTNFWYGAILGSEGEGGDKNRLIAELDSLAAIGVDNLRILVGADGVNGVTAKVEPTLQVAPGVYNDTILAGLDYLLCEWTKEICLQYFI